MAQWLRARVGALWTAQECWVLLSSSCVHCGERVGAGSVFLLVWKSSLVWKYKVLTDKDFPQLSMRWQTLCCGLTLKPVVEKHHF